MQTTTNTLVLERREAILSLKKKACKLLQWDDFQYGEFKHTTGIAYLHWLLPCDDKLREKLESSKIFWTWFKNCWAHYEESLLSYNRSLQECSLQTRREAYETLFCPRTLIMDWKINDAVIESIKEKKEAQL